MKTTDVYSSGFWLLIGLSVFLRAPRLGLGKIHEPGPGFIFFLAGGLLTLLSAIQLTGALLMRSNEKQQFKQVWSGLKWQRILLVLAALSLWTYFFDVLGFSIATLLLLIVLFRAVDPTKWWVAIITALITVAVSYLFFNVWLKVPFPRGIIGI